MIEVIFHIDSWCIQDEKSAPPHSKYVQELYESNDKTYFIKNNLNGCLFKFRIIQYTVNKIVYYIGTTLCDSQFTIDILKELYKMRWNIESHCGFAEILSNIISAEPRFKDFHSKSEDQIKQEIYTHECGRAELLF